MWSIHIQSKIEKMGIPTVSVITTPFTQISQAAAELNGIPNLRKAVIPHPVADLTEEELQNNISKVYDSLVASLTSPLTSKELERGTKRVPKRERFVFEGSLQEVQNKFIELGLTDGLPIIPPTEDLVKKMLEQTNLPPNKIIGKMPPENFEVTIEKVAINGVMAGCTPEYMPVLLALAEALMDPVLDMEGGARSTNSFGFWGFANGPIAKKIGLNAEGNALGPGNRANATLGRVIRLFINNLGGSKVGINDMSSVGSPLKYGLFFAENESDSPWEPYHVEKGFNREESTVTLYKSLGFRTSGRTGIGGIDLNNLVGVTKNIECMFGYSPNRGMVILLDPLLAKQFSDQGLTKRDIKEYIWQSLHRTVQEWKASYSYTVDLRAGIFPQWYDNLSPDVKIPMFKSPENIDIVVVGGKRNLVFQVYEGGSPVPGVTKSIDKWKVTTKNRHHFFLKHCQA
ncbi:MAG TPA: hypothetical protein GX699_10905 [Firmicutes bacterium]|nr:hypothetical protein [Bacillota bacterium]